MYFGKTEEGGGAKVSKSPLEFYFIHFCFNVVDHESHNKTLFSYLLFISQYMLLNAHHFIAPNQRSGIINHNCTLYYSTFM